MKKFSVITHYILLLNSNFLISFSIFYRDLELFNANFGMLQRTPLELFLIFNLLNISFYLVVDYVYQLESKFIHFGIVFSITLVFSIMLLWTFKFVDASRLFLLIYCLLFYISLIISTRTKNNISTDIYVTFDKSLALSSENMIYTDEEKFPDDFLN